MTRTPEPDAPPDRPGGAPETPGAEQRPLFLHPQWMVGVVVVLGVAAVLAGLNNPVWFIIGAPCILVLIVWVWVRVWGGGRP